MLFFYLERKDISFSKYSILEIGFIVLTLIYIISIFMAANRSLAIQEALKYINYLLILTMTKRLINSTSKTITTLVTLLTAGVFVVLIGIGSALETFHYEGAFVGGMMSSTFQYHNTFGAYCLSILFIGYMLLGKFQNKARYFIGISTFLLFFGLVISYSRGAWVLVPLIGFVYYLLTPLQYKKTFVSELIGNIAGIAVIINPFTRILEETNKSEGWLWILVGIVISLAVSYVIEKALDKLNIKERVFNVVIPILALGIPAIGLLFKNSILGFLPDALSLRLGSISLSTETVTERTVFYKNAFQIVKDYPILGTGGGGWSTLYPSYQSYAYVSSQTHNYYMQLWIEIGTIGIIVFAAIILLYLYQFFRSYKLCEDDRTKALLVAIFTAVLSILAHSTIDFNFALSAVAILVWGLIGLQLAIGHPGDEIKIAVGKKVSYLILGLSLILLANSTTNYLAYNAVGQGIKHMQAKQVSKGVQQFKKATILDPFKPEYLADYANITNGIAVQNKDQSAIEASIKRMDRAVQLGRYDKVILTNATGFYFKNKAIDKAIATMNQLEEHFPLGSETYENKTSLYVVVAKHYIQIGKKEEAEKLLQYVVEVDNIIHLLNQKISETVKMNNMVRFVEITQQTQENIKEAKELLKQFS